MTKELEFFRNYPFSVDGDTKKIQKAGLSLFKAFAEICERNNLKYWAYGGTLIGAVRHGGYIPWDDDIDVMMPRTDLERLKNIVSEESLSLYVVKEYCIIEHSWLYYKFETRKHHFFIDIMPVDSFLSNKTEENLRIDFENRYSMKIYDSFRMRKKLARKYKTQLCMEYINKEDRNYISSFFNKYKKINTTGNIKYLSIGLESALGSSAKINSMPENKIYPLKKIKFEDTEICVPKYPEYLLSLQFGDYLMPVYWSFDHYSSDSIKEIYNFMKSIRPQDFVTKVEQGYVDHHKEFELMIGKYFSFLSKIDGDQDIYYRLGYMREFGIGAKKDINKAIRFFQRALNMGHEPARIKLFDLLCLRKRPSDLKRAYKLVNSYDDDTNCEIIGRLARCNFHGIGIDKNVEKSFNLYSKSMKHKNVWSIEYIDKLLQMDTPEYDAKAYKICKKLVEYGHNDAIMRIGRMHRDGRGTVLDLENALYFMERAASKNFSYIPEYAALALKNNPDLKDISVLFPDVLESNVGAMLTLARMYRNGIGVDKDLSKSVSWMIKAADRNPELTIECVDTLLESTDPGDHAEAFRRCAEIAEDNIGAMVRLARMYRNGIGVERNLSLSEKWSRKASVDTP